MKCRNPHCSPDYCACADFFKSWRAYYSGEMDDRLTPEQRKRRDDARKAAA